MEEKAGDAATAFRAFISTGAQPVEAALPVNDAGAALARDEIEI